MGSEKVKPKVLHVLKGMDPGGVESWVMNVFREVADRVSFDFVVSSPGKFDEEIEGLGGRVLIGPDQKHRLAFARYFDSIVRETPYAAVHAHGRHAMSYAVSHARVRGVPRRIAHVHNVKQVSGTAVKNLLVEAATRVIVANATSILGCSHDALYSLIRGHHDRSKASFFPYGIHVDKFQFDPRAAAEVKEELAVPPGKNIVGTVGRMVWEKNHEFLLEMISGDRAESLHLVIVGDGPNRGKLESMARSLGCEKRVTFAGRRVDIGACMSAFDHFVFPSVSEGLGLVAIEAQASGLPVLASLHIPREITLAGGDVTFLELDVNGWIEQLASSENTPEETRSNAFHTVAGSPFNIAVSSRTLLAEHYGIVD